MIGYRALSKSASVPSTQASLQLSTVPSVVHEASPHSAIPVAVLQKQLSVPYLVMSHVPPASTQLSLAEQLRSLRNFVAGSSSFVQTESV